MSYLFRLEFITASIESCCCYALRTKNATVADYVIKKIVNKSLMHQADQALQQIYLFPIFFRVMLYYSLLHRGVNLNQRFNRLLEVGFIIGHVPLMDENDSDLCVLNTTLFYN